MTLDRLGNIFAKLSNGFTSAIGLNYLLLNAKLSGRKTLAFHISTASQMPHLESVIREMLLRGDARGYSVFLLTGVREIGKVKARLESIGLAVSVQSELSARFLLFCDMVLSVDQGMVYPYFGCKSRACCFHGQPSKGNTFAFFNFRQINTLFFYGPLMRENYFRAKKENPNWPSIVCHDVGQPLSDAMINSAMEKATARRALGIDTSTYTVLYAPSFEYCSSIALCGDEIIETLLELEINLIVKPHPAFYNTCKFSDEFNGEIPNSRNWRGRIEKYSSRRNCIFSHDGSLDVGLAIAAADLMLTDYSGVAFDGFLQDLKLVFWDCPLLFSEYLPRRYGIDGETAKTDLACNVGRSAGILVKDSPGLVDAVMRYRKDPEYLRSQREAVRGQLLFNRGNATAAMVEAIEKKLGKWND